MNKVQLHEVLKAVYMVKVKRLTKLQLKYLIQVKTLSVTTSLSNSGL